MPLPNMADSVSSELSTSDWELFGDNGKAFIQEPGAENKNLNYELQCKNESLNDSNRHLEDNTAVSSDMADSSLSEVQELGRSTKVNDLLYSQIKIITSSKVLCYKHNRNEKLNSALSLILALEIAIVFGLGSGHFLAWSHKCRCIADCCKMLPVVKSSHEMMDNNMVIESPVLDKTPHKLYDISSNKEVMGNILILNYPEKNGGMEEVCSETTKNNENVLKLCNSFNSSAFHQNTPKLNRKNEKNESVLFHEYLINLKHVFPSNQDVLSVVIPTRISDEIYHPQTMKVGEKGENEVIKKLSLASQQLIENNFLNHIKNDFSYIIQSLTFTAVVHLSKLDMDSATLRSKEELVTNVYNNFHMDFKNKISDIEDFMRNPIYKTSKNSRTKVLKKMVFILVNSVDNFLRINLKTFKKDFGHINTEELVKRIFKSQKRLNKNWQKVKELLSNGEEFYYHYHDLSKKTEKHWKKKANFNKDHRKYKYFHKSDKSWKKITKKA